MPGQVFVDDRLGATLAVYGDEILVYACEASDQIRFSSKFVIGRHSRNWDLLRMCTWRLHPC